MVLWREDERAVALEKGIGILLNGSFCPWGCGVCILTYTHTMLFLSLRACVQDAERVRWLERDINGSLLFYDFYGCFFEFLFHDALHCSKGQV